jgi:DNA-binding transcriptional LysR family regulator
MVECENIKKAAEKLYVDQPTVKRGLQNLEIELGYTLFLKQGKKLELTEYGEKLYEIVREIFEKIDSIDGELKKIKDQSFSSLNVYSSHQPFLDFISFYMLSNFPSIKLRCNRAFDIDPEDMASNHADLVICSYTKEEARARVDQFRKVGYFPMFLVQERMFLVVPPEHKLAKWKSIYFEELVTNNIELIKTREINYLALWIQEMEKERGIACNFQEIAGVEMEEIKYTTEYPYLASSFFIAMKKDKKIRQQRTLIKLNDDDAIRNLYAFYPKENYKKIAFLLDVLIRRFYDLY